MAGGWGDYNCSPKKEGGQVYPFEQSEDFLKGIKLSVETSEGCCMAMTRFPLLRNVYPWAEFRLS